MEETPKTGRNSALGDLAASLMAVARAGEAAGHTDTPAVELPDDVLREADNIYQTLKPDAE
jgi:hypothetical protein